MVEAVIISLLLVSISTRAITVGQAWRIRREMAATQAFEREMWHATVLPQSPRRPTLDEEGREEAHDWGAGPGKFRV